MSKSPSYFAGDVRRLKIVTIDTLTERAERSGCLAVPTLSPLHRTMKQKLDFFKCSNFCLVLSNKGQTSEASRMSGGDYGKVDFVSGHVVAIGCFLLFYFLLFCRWRQCLDLLE